MIGRRFFLASAASAAALAAPPALAAVDPEAAKTFIRTLANEAIQLMGRKDLPQPERIQKFRELSPRASTSRPSAASCSAATGATRPTPSRGNI
jgi:hypothetical protein